MGSGSASGWMFLVAVGAERPLGSGGEYAAADCVTRCEVPPGLQADARLVRLHDVGEEAGAMRMALKHLGYRLRALLFRERGVATYSVRDAAGASYLIDVEIVRSSFTREAVVGAAPVPPTPFGPFPPFHFP